MARRWVLRRWSRALLVWPAPSPARRKRKLLDKSTFFQMESVSSPAISPDGTTVAVLARLRGHDARPEPIQPLGDRHHGRAAAPAHRRRLERFVARVVARRQADRVPVGSVGIDAAARDVGSTRASRCSSRGSSARRARSPGRPTASRSRSRASSRTTRRFCRCACPRCRAARSSRAARWSSIGRPGRRTDRARRRAGSRTCSRSTRRVGGTPRQVTTGNFNHSAPSWSADGKIDLRVGHPQARRRVPRSATPRSTPSTSPTGVDQRR